MNADASLSVNLKDRIFYRVAGWLRLARNVPRRDAWADRTELISEIDRHISHTVAPVDSVFHEIVSDDLHIDLHIIQPSVDRPFYSIVTSGMSELPMRTPQDEIQYAELCILLESSWQLSQEAFVDEGWYWPLRLLKTLARYPNENGTWLGYGHTVALSKPPQPFATNTKLCAALIVPSMTLGEAFFTMKRSDGQTTHFWTVVPLYDSELEFKMANDVDELLDAFDRAGVDDVVRRDRRAAV